MAVLALRVSPLRGFMHQQLVLSEASQGQPSLRVCLVLDKGLGCFLSSWLLREPEARLRPSFLDGLALVMASSATFELSCELHLPDCVTYPPCVTYLRAATQ